MSKDLDRFLDYEEAFHERQERSYRPTKKPKREESQKESLCGTVLALYPEAIVVDVLGKHFRCQIKGSLKKDKTQDKNLVVVGDSVLIQPIDADTGLVSKVLPRRSVLSRADNLLRRKQQLIAANVDQVIITACVLSPPLKVTLIDRYIIAALKGNMTPIIVVNKIDLLENEEDRQLLSLLEQTYRELDISFLQVSTKSLQGLEELKNLMHGKTSVFSGQSGTGKSSLINAITGSQLRTGEVIERTLKGSHTTTSTQLLPVEGGGFCVDTPGIRSFGVWDLEEKEVESYFTEIAEAALRCRFQGCHHDTEPECAVKQALEEGSISPLRFESYLSLLATLQEEHKNR